MNEPKFGDYLPEYVPEEREAREALGRVQIAMYLPCSCDVCGHEYTDVDDFIKRDPRLITWGPPMRVACDECYKEQADDKS
jgi:hypothetical protein